MSKAFIVEFSNATIEYSSVCGGVRAHMCVWGGVVCVCVLLHGNMESNQSSSMKFKYAVVYENSSAFWDQGQVIVDLQKFSLFNAAHITHMQPYN